MDHYCIQMYLVVATGHVIIFTTNTMFYYFLFFYFAHSIFILLQFFLVNNEAGIFYLYSLLINLVTRKSHPIKKTFLFWGHKRHNWLVVILFRYYYYWNLLWNSWASQIIISTSLANDMFLSLIHIWRCRRIERCRSRWSPYH